MIGGNYSTEHGGWPLSDGSVGIRFDLTAVQLTNLIIKVPSITENDPISSTASFITKHVSRMFYTDGVTLFFSKIDKPEAFPPSNNEPVNPDDGERIIGLVSVNDGLLLVFKEFSIYALVGSDPNSWEIRQVSESIGLSGVRGLTALDGVVYWWSQYGPYQWSAQGGVKPLGFGSVSNEFADDKVAVGQFPFVVVDKDTERQRIFFAYAESGLVRNTKLLVYNHRLQVWEGTWDPMDISTLGILPNDQGAPFLYIGNYKGRLFRIWDGATDGARITSSGTNFTLTGSPTTSSSTTLTDSGATFDTTGNALDQLFILNVSTDGTVQRRIITTTLGATQVQVSPAWTTNPTTSDTYYIASPDFSWTTYYSDRIVGRDGFLFSSPFRRKRFKKFFLSAISSTGNALVSIDIFLDGKQELPEMTLTATATEVTGGVFGTGVFGTAVFGSAGTDVNKKRIGRTGRNIGYKIRNREVNTQLLLLEMGHMATTVSDKL